MISSILLATFFLKIYGKLPGKTKEIFNYLVVGAFTTVISILTYNTFRFFLENYTLCTVLSWIIAVIFAYVTNRKYVFQSSEKNIFKEFVSFISSRILSLFFELVSMYILVEFIKIDDRLSKIFVQFIVIILNYVFSKLFVFKRNNL